MRYMKIDPKKIAILFEGYEADDSLVDLIKDKGSSAVPPIPVYELPDKLKGEHKFILTDGHHRRDAAIRAGSDIACIVYDPYEEINAQDHGLVRFAYPGKDADYNLCISTYTRKV